MDTVLCTFDKTASFIMSLKCLLNIPLNQL